MPFPNLDGRPEEYTDDLPNKVVAYCNECLENKKLPTTAGLAVYIGISRSTLFEWRDKHTHFSDSVEGMLAFQEDDVWQKALKGEYNSVIAKLLLNNHGYSDKVQTDNLNKNVEVDPEDHDGKDPEERLQNVLKKIQDLKKD